MNSGRYLAVCRFCAAATIAGVGMATVGCQSQERSCPCPHESTMRINFPPQYETPSDQPTAEPAQERQDTDSRMKRYHRRPSRWRVKLRAKYASGDGFNPIGVTLSAY